MGMPPMLAPWGPSHVRPYHLDALCAIMIRIVFISYFALLTTSALENKIKTVGYLFTRTAWILTFFHLISTVMLYAHMYFVSFIFFTLYYVTIIILARTIKVTPSIL